MNSEQLWKHLETLWPIRFTLHGSEQWKQAWSAWKTAWDRAYYPSGELRPKPDIPPEYHI